MSSDREPRIGDIAARVCWESAMIDGMRRRVLLAAGMLAGAVPVRARAAALTPSQTAGPFYPRASDLTGDDDWDLVKIEGRVAEAGGEVLDLTGRVLDRAGAPVAGTVVEIWQCDVNGRYLHAGDRQAVPRDAGFQGFGKAVTDEAGRYRFRTIRPVPYPGRTPHIHARVARADGSWLTTQIYVEGDPGNRTDFLFRRLGRAGQAAASMRLGPGTEGGVAASFDFVV